MRIIIKSSSSLIEKNAIELAVKTAGKTDIVVIAGKGHETYQEIQGVRYDFDDLAVLGEFLQKISKIKKVIKGNRMTNSSAYFFGTKIT